MVDILIQKLLFKEPDLDVNICIYIKMSCADKNNRTNGLHDRQTDMRLTDVRLKNIIHSLPSTCYMGKKGMEINDLCLYKHS